MSAYHDAKTRSLTVALDPATKARIRELSQEWHVSMSQVVRVALACMLDGRDASGGASDGAPGGVV